MKEGNICLDLSLQKLLHWFFFRILATFYTREKIYNTISKYEIYFWTSSIDEIKWKLMKIENLPQYFIGKQTLFRGKDEYKP